MESKADKGIKDQMAKEVQEELNKTEHELEVCEKGEPIDMGCMIKKDYVPTKNKGDTTNEH